MANKTKKEACARPGRGGRSKHYSGRGRPRGGRRRKLKEREENGGDEEEVEVGKPGEADDADEEEEEHLVPCVDKEEAERTEERKTPRGSGKRRRIAVRGERFQSFTLLILCCKKSRRQCWLNLRPSG